MKLGLVITTTKKLKCLIYRVYKNFMFENFKSDLQEALHCCKDSYDAFDNYFTQP